MAINLLPPKEKKALNLEITQRKISLVLAFASISLLVLILMPLVIERFINQEVSKFDISINVKNDELRTKQFQGFKEVVNKTNKDLALITSVWQEQFFLTPVFEKIANLIPLNIYFTSFSFGEAEGELGFKISIRGVAQKRDDLFQFKKALEEDSQFENIYFAPYSWIKPVETDFSLTLTLR